jgi:uncharacterized protein DUF3309
MDLPTLLIVVVLVLLLVGALPNWGYSSGWGYGPVGILLVVILVVLLFRLL